MPALARIAERLEGTAAQAGVDALTAQMAHGNLNPGKGNRYLFAGIHEARSATGGRVYFRNTGEAIEILAKSNKGDQDHVISILRGLYDR